MNIIDRTSQAAGVFRTRGGRNIFSRGNPRVRRNVARIDPVILHQTTFFDHSAARYDCVINNYIVQRIGNVLFTRELSMGLNSVGTDYRGIDIEFEGNFPAVAEISADSVLPTPIQIAVGRQLVNYFRNQHSQVNKIFAQAQYRAKNCPGLQLWCNIGEWFLHPPTTTSGQVPMIQDHRGTRPLPRSWTDASLAIAAP
jgi:hypothetical protein